MWRCASCQTVNPAGGTTCVGCARPRQAAAAGDETRLRAETTPAPPIVVGPAPGGSRRPSPVAYAGLVIGGLLLVALISLVVVVVRGNGSTEVATAPETTSTTATATTTTPVVTPAPTVTVTIAPSSPTPNRPTTAPIPPTTETPYIPPAGVRSYTNVDPVNLRAAPSLTARIYARIPAGTSLPAICATRGDLLEGGGGGPNSDDADNDIWIRTHYQGDDGWVTDAVMLTHGDSTDGTIDRC